MVEALEISQDLSFWEEHISNCHNKNMDFTLDRVKKVASNAGLLEKNSLIITVAGTNGKGTSCKLLSETLVHYKKKVGLFSSPHILKINERFNVNGKLVDDIKLAEAFCFIENSREGIPLTYFEFCTLAAFYLFKSESMMFGS